MKLSNISFGKGGSKKRTSKRNYLDVIEKRIIWISLIGFAVVLIYIGVYLLIHGFNIDVSTERYMTLTEAEAGTKEVYGSVKDASGNVANLNNLTAISCYGDSYNNAPDDSTASFPGVLSYLAQRTVYNVSVDSDTIFEMAARQGGKPIQVSPFIIPPTKASTEVIITNEDGMELNFDYSKNGGLNPCTIQGVEGLLSIINDKYYFTRAESGDETLVLTPTTVETRAMQLRTKDICVFFLGDDKIFETPEKAVEIYQSMVDFLAKSENKNYLVIGPIKGEIETLDKANRLLSEAFGDNFLDLREYLINQAHTDLGIQLSEDDKVLADNSIVPYIYFSNHNNNTEYFSAEGADAAGLAVFDKLESLGYFADNENNN